MNMNELHFPIYLQDFDCFGRYTKLESLSGEYEFVVASEGHLSNPVFPAGRFWFDGKTFFALIRYKGSLFVRIGQSVIELSDKITIKVTGASPDRVLTIIEDGHPIQSSMYSVKQNLTFENDPTPFVDDEDFDFGLFLANVSVSASKKKVLLE